MTLSIISHENRNLYTVFLLLFRQNVRREKDDLEWEALENTKLLARTGPMDGYKPNKNFSLENELKVGNLNHIPICQQTHTLSRCFSMYTFFRGSND